MSEIKSENQPTWADIEVALATEIVEESKKKSRRCSCSYSLSRQQSDRG